ncbi:C2 family cysteine protease [Actinomadura madurae]|uniref:C2 family cysteine protease n=1 Tax=Actinomadura madurae TaxID=1993 RepID=UPI0020271D19|nr:C2 family cysteine protease [Actinomadura madurae]URM99381.1 C2 family cysteine protease [Actinomadura madurae]
MDRPTGTDTKVENADQPEPPGKPPAPPPDKPGSPGQPSRLESLARARQPVQQEDGTQKTEDNDSSAGPAGERRYKPAQAGSGEVKADDSGEPEPASEGEKQDAVKSLTNEGERGAGEKPDAGGEGASDEQPSTSRADTPCSPSRESRLESLARAREPGRQEGGSQEPDEVMAPAEGGGIAADGDVDVPVDSGRIAGRPAEEEIGTSDSETELPVGQKEDPLARQDDHKPGTGDPAALRDEQDHSQAADTPDDFDRRISGDGPPDDNGSMADLDEEALERGISDRLKQLAAKLDRGDKPEEFAGTVDRPDFQDPWKDPEYVPDCYGAPLDRADGTRTPLFNGEPAREQTQQGSLGDCGIIATLGAVAGCHPEAIRDCVRETGDGNYEVRLHEAKYSAARQRYEPTGRPITLKVTPDLPVKDQHPDTPAFAKTTSAGVAWAPILEKAIAGTDQTWSAARRDRAAELWKAQKKPGDAPTGYVRLNQGSSPGERAELLTQLTGLPAKTVQFPEGYDNRGRSADRRLQDEITGQLSSNKPVLVGTRELREGETNLPKKLADSHAYEVTKIDDQGNFHLRNPWNKRHPQPMTIQEFRANIRPRYTSLE